jgi:hypothetical protein
MNSRAMVWSAAVPLVLTATLGVTLIAGDLSLEPVVQLLQALGDFLDRIAGMLQGAGSSGGAAGGASEFLG